MSHWPKNNTLAGLFGYYAARCEPWEVSFTHAGFTQSPHDWLKNSDGAALQVPLAGCHTSGQGCYYTVAHRTEWEIIALQYHLHWHPERHGWHKSVYSCVVHYFVPGQWLTPPKGFAGTLFSLCQRADTPNNEPFNAASESDIPSCKVCSQLHARWNSGA